MTPGGGAGGLACGKCGMSISGGTIHNGVMVCDWCRPKSDLAIAKLVEALRHVASYGPGSDVAQKALAEYESGT